jgi:hypothetical protein
VMYYKTEKDLEVSTYSYSCKKKNKLVQKIRTKQNVWSSLENIPLNENNYEQSSLWVMYHILISRMWLLY